jgi:hypothetical protein
MNFCELWAAEAVASDRELNQPFVTLVLEAGRIHKALLDWLRLTSCVIAGAL